MVASKKKNINPLDIKIRGVRIKEIEQFEYLGSKITRDGRCKCEIKSGVVQTRKIFQQMSVKRSKPTLIRILKFVTLKSMCGV